MTARTLIPGGLVVCVLALAVGSAQGATAAAAATKGRAGSSQGKARLCPTRRVRFNPGVVRRISIRCDLHDKALARRVNAAPARIVRRPAGGAVLNVNRPGNLVRYRTHAVGRDRFVVVRRDHGVRWRLVVRVKVPAPPPPPTCASEEKTTNYQTAVQLLVTCSGSGVAPMDIAAYPSHGSVGPVIKGGGSSARTLTATYTPAKLYVGGDELRVEAKNPGGRTEYAAKVKVQPWRMRALGDSATAGFGFRGNTAHNGEEIEVGQIEECVPPTVPNDRCSSNSELGPGATGGVAWSPDFGLTNDISWAAQFANDWQGPGHITAPLMYQNHAVTGSTPANWLPGGILHGVLETTVSEDPDLIAFTLGVNPLLNLILVEGEEKKCIQEATEVPKLVGCIEKIFNRLEVSKRLKNIYEELLDAPHAEVVTFQYHFAYPFLAILKDEFQPWQVEVLINYLNLQIALAVRGAKIAMLPTQASRLTLIEAQVSPADTSRLKVPRFNVGVPANANQPWKGSFECGAGGFTVDGESHQSTFTQDVLPSMFSNKFCSGTPWTIEADTGIHPNKLGYTQFAEALIRVATADGLVPRLP